MNWLMLPAAIWLIIAAWQDIREREVSNWLTVPPVLLAAGWWACLGEWAVPGFLGAILLFSELPPVVGVPLGLTIAGVLSLHSQPITLILMVWTCAWISWNLNLFGGADAKVIMALSGFWPDVRLVGLLVVAHLLWNMYHLLHRYRSKAWQVALAGAMLTPSREELEAQGTITLPAYAAAGVLYFVWRISG